MASSRIPRVVSQSKASVNCGRSEGIGLCSPWAEMLQEGKTQWFWWWNEQVAAQCPQSRAAEIANPDRFSLVLICVLGVQPQPAHASIKKLPWICVGTADDMGPAQNISPLCHLVMGPWAGSSASAHTPWNVLAWSNHWEMGGKCSESGPITGSGCWNLF